MKATDEKLKNTTSCSYFIRNFALSFSTYLRNGAVCPHRSLKLWPPQRRYDDRGERVGRERLTYKKAFTYALVKTL